MRLFLLLYLLIFSATSLHAEDQLSLEDKIKNYDFRLDYTFYVQSEARDTKDDAIGEAFVLLVEDFTRYVLTEIVEGIPLTAEESIDLLYLEENSPYELAVDLLQSEVEVVEFEDENSYVIRLVFRAEPEFFNFVKNAYLWEEETIAAEVFQ